MQHLSMGSMSDELSVLPQRDPCLGPEISLTLLCVVKEPVNTAGNCTRSHAPPPQPGVLVSVHCSNLG